MKLTRGTKVTFERNIMFKGTETATAKIVMVHPNGYILLDSGETVIQIGKKFSII